MQIVVGSIVAKAPNSPLAQPALEQINAAFELFDRAAQQQSELMGRPAKALVSCSSLYTLTIFLKRGFFFVNQAVVTRLRYRAHQAITRYHANKHGAGALPPDLGDNLGEHDEELHILGGHTRIVSGRSSSTPSTTQSPASAGSPDALYHRSSPKSTSQRGFTPETLDKAHPALLADLRTTKEREEAAVCTQYAAGPTGSFTPAAATVPSSGYDPQQQTYPQPKFALPQVNTESHPSGGRAGQPALDPWSGNANATVQPTNLPNAAAGSTGYIPAPSDTHSAFGMLGGDPNWDMQWHSFMDQLGMFTNDPNAPYVAAAQLKRER